MSADLELNSVVRNNNSVENKSSNLRMARTPAG